MSIDHPGLRRHSPIGRRTRAGDSARLSQIGARRLRIQCVTGEEIQQSALETLTFAWVEGLVNLVEGLVNLHELRADLQRRAEKSTGTKK
uniref:hypothetical protein n=1 Tax=Nocardia suismassiliense TaxID=2077092 RepID=UPI003F490E85